MSIAGEHRSQWAAPESGRGTAGRPSLCEKVLTASPLMDQLSALPPENWKYSRQPRRDGLPTMQAEPGSISGSPSHSQKQKSSNDNISLAQSDMPIILAPTPRRHLIESSASKHWLYNPSITPPSSRPVSALSQSDRHYHHTTRNSISQHYVGPGSPQSPASVLQSNISTSSPNAVRRRRLSGSVSHQPRKYPDTSRAREKVNVPSTTLAMGGLPGDSSYGTVRVTGGGLRMYGPEPEGSAMGRRWLRWMHKRGLKQWVVPGLICASAMVKLMVGLGSYSGMYFSFAEFMEVSRRWSPENSETPCTLGGHVVKCLKS